MSTIPSETVQPAMVLDGKTRVNRLISADKVHGTEVYNRGGDHLGSVDSIMIDKASGKVAYVVMSFGGFLGIGEKYHPLPWEVLDYEPAIGGYRVDLDRDALIDAPSYSRADIDAYDYERNAADIDGYYAGMPRNGSLLG
ncbi:MAG: PRC-barrel domain-containing protein [Sandarakinorhabdus sp.]|nr:PRC-barrel domain-containing protein [Sandarakinorhabdus sp.]